MCKGSVIADYFVDATDGMELQISFAKYGMPVFHEPGIDPSSCVICVRDGTVVTLENIPIEVQRQYSIAGEVMATFKDTGDGDHDLITLVDGSAIALSEFAARGVNVYVGVRAINRDEVLERDDALAFDEQLVLA